MFVVGRSIGALSERRKVSACDPKRTSDAIFCCNAQRDASRPKFIYPSPTGPLPPKRPATVRTRELLVSVLASGLTTCATTPRRSHPKHEVQPRVPIEQPLTPILPHRFLDSLLLARAECHLWSSTEVLSGLRDKSGGNASTYRAS